MTITLLAPMRGWAAPLEEVPDPVFSGRMLGDGVAIDPTGSTLHAPCDGEILSVAATGHAVALRGDSGVEILMHIGLETVALNGEGFTAHVHAGQRVKAGALLIVFDIDRVARQAKTLLTPVLVTNADAFEIVWREQDREVEVGDHFIDAKASPAKATTRDAPQTERRRTVRLGLPHGLHARPSARLASLAKRFAAEISLSAHGRNANAKSPVSLMALGAARGDELAMVTQGSDAEAALDVLCAFLMSDGGETIALSAPVRAPVPFAVPSDGVLKGVTAVPGQAVGRAYQFRRAAIRVVEAGADAAQEQAALAVAMAQVRTGLEASRQSTSVGGEIMAAHVAMLDDPDLLAIAHRLIAGGKSAGFAWSGAIDAQTEIMRHIDDARLRARAGDLLDLKRQVLLALSSETDTVEELPNDAILVADDLLPSELLTLDGRIGGLCTAAGGPTSHVAIIAAAFNVPMVVALGAPVLGLLNGVSVILDADAGTLKIDPNPEDLAAAQTAVRRRAEVRRAATTAAQEPCRMADGARIEVFANLAAVTEAGPAAANGAEGCGLLRTEFLFMDRDTPPSEDEQHAAYQAIANAFEGRPITVRTMDVGGDKPVAYLAMPKEENPALGLRGVRASLWRPALLRTQLRAILRVTPLGVCKILIPMVSSLEEMVSVRQILDEERRALRIEASPSLGAMIETPAAAVTTAAIAGVADFLSIGANDLTQYALVMDRTNPAVAAQVDALHPAVLRLIALTCEGARSRERPVAVCGALAAQPMAAPLLIGLGVTELSAPPSSIPALKAAIRPLRLQTCRDLAAQALTETSADAVRALLIEAQAKMGGRETPP